MRRKEKLGICGMLHPDVGDEANFAKMLTKICVFLSYRRLIMMMSGIPCMCHMWLASVRATGYLN